MQATVNTSIWGMGLVLQGALAAALLWRGVARRLPLFTGLVGFYAVRSAVLYGISGHVSRAAMGRAYDGLAVVDLLLQLLVAAELVHAGLRPRGGWTTWQGGTAAVAVSVAALAGWMAGRLWMTRGRVSMDRWQMGVAVLFVLAFAWTMRVGAAGVARRILGGFAVYSAVDLVAQAERYRSALVRDAGSYAGWSYVVAGVYLALVGFWLAVVLRAGAAPATEDGKRPVLRSDEFAA